MRNKHEYNGSSNVVLALINPQSFVHYIFIFVLSFDVKCFSVYCDACKCQQPWSVSIG